jgi:hypothetical protein
MPILSAYQDLSFTAQMLHGLHFMLCTFAVLAASVPMLTAKGSAEHKFGGLVYVPIAGSALLLGSAIAWHETSLILFCFNSFCAYLLFSGWRAVHEKEKPELVDWAIPGSLFVLSIAVTLYALIYDEGLTSFYLFFFALNAFYLAQRDWRHLKSRAFVEKNRVFLVDISFGKPPMQWLNRHIAGMAGSALANLSVVVLTLLPLSLHWLWPTTLVVLALFIARREAKKRAHLRAALAPILKPAFMPTGFAKPRQGDEKDWKRAA